jgi:hypothetical protein
MSFGFIFDQHQKGVGYLYWSMLKSRPLHREWQSFDRMLFDIKHQPGIRLLPSRKLSFNVPLGFAAKFARVLYHFPFTLDFASFYPPCGRLQIYKLLP